MTNLYFVRHAEVIYTEDDHTRPLSDKGKESTFAVTNFFKKVDIDAIVSSPYIRALDTIQGVANDKGIAIECHENLRERKVAHSIIDNFDSFSVRQWKDFNFKLEGGESLAEVQKRGIESIRHLLDIHKNKNVIIGTHGTFLAVHLNYYESRYNYEFWKSLQKPDVFRLQFQDSSLVEIDNPKLTI